MNTRHIFITGGVVSSLGKGICAASLGFILKSKGLSVGIQKLDPYINVDPGTMNPFEHGEVFVTCDGRETDLDIGHYERFLDVDLDQYANITTGKIYLETLEKERKGGFNGKTVQVVPHITNAIKEKIVAAAQGKDVLITEIGGTVGDIESQPFLEALRQIRQDFGEKRVFFIHISLMPYLLSAGEIKTKPTQHSVSLLRSFGISPDAVILRSEKKIDSNIKEKISLMTSIPKEAVIGCADEKDIYFVPEALEKQKIDKIIADKFDIPLNKSNIFEKWNRVYFDLSKAEKSVKIALVGKYTHLKDTYLSIREALRSCAFYYKTDIDIKYVDSESESLLDDLHGVDGICIPGGFGIRGVEGKIATCKYARENDIPLLGICLGMQCMAIEFARNICNIEDAGSAEFSGNLNDIIAPIETQVKHIASNNLGATARLGGYKASLDKSTISYKLYGKEEIFERHRHRYELNGEHIKMLESNGLKVAAFSKDQHLAEIIELPGHKFYIGTQAHPEFLSRPLKPHPLFKGFIKACLD